MVFPSVPSYLDPPIWNNQETQQQPRVTSGGGGSDAQRMVPPVGMADVGGLPSSSATGEASEAQLQNARPNSMTERARMARAPLPEPALKCPRCDSTNTKFCYYNNYSLSQPRHFCKACRRYWTRGGALRTVPVGGGLRRNKRPSKSSSSSSKPSSSSARQLPAGSAPSMPHTGASGAPGLNSMSHHNLPFMRPMHPPGPNLGRASFSVGLQPLGMQQHMAAMDQFPLASGGSATFSASMDQWRVQQQQQQHQFPFLGGALDQLPPPQPMWLQQLNRAGTAAVAPAAMFTLGQSSSSSAIAARQDVSIKVHQEDSKGQEVSLHRQYMEALRQGDGVWGDGGSWTTMNIPGFNSSSTGGDDGGDPL